MTRAVSALIAAALVLSGASAPAGANTPRTRPGPELRRIAVLLSNNDGGPDRPTLRWADKDASELGAVLVSLGGVAPADRLVAPNASRALLLATLATADLLARTASAAGQRVELIVYYSGHADALGLRLGREVLPFAELRERVLGIGAALTLTIVDACASGHLLRKKGGTHAPPILRPSGAISGQVFLTSAAEDELAQESDRLESSFFTHDLLAALRGAADFDQDRQVTLTEAYRYAQEATQARSRRTAGTPQSPSWDLSLVGSGDLVLTHLDGLDGASRATLVLDATLSGRLTLFSGRSRLVLELDKASGDTVRLALPPGDYRLQLVRERRLFDAPISLSAGATHISTDKHLVFRDMLEDTRARGGPPTTHLRLALVPTLGLDGPGHASVVHGASLSLIGDAVAEIRGAQLGLGLNIVEDLVGAQIGLANAADELRGAQIGLVNIAGHVTGAQVGLVNIARHVTGAQIGWFTWVESGLHHLELYASTEHATTVGWRLGSPWLHSVVALGFDPFASGGDCGLQLAFGSRLDFSPVTIDLDLGPTLTAPRCSPARLGETGSLGLRAVLGVELGSGLGLIAGGRIAVGFDGDTVTPGALVGLRLFR